MTMKYPKLMAVLCLFLILAASTFNIQQASMVDGWAGMDTTVHPSTDGDACTEQSIEVNSSYYQITETQNACVTYGKDIDLASRYFYTEDGVYAHVGVRYKGEDTFVPIWLPGYIYLIPGTNTFIYDDLYHSVRSNAIFILENANNALQPQYSGSDYIYRYTLNGNGRKLVFPVPESNPWYKNSYRVSQDGRYIVANFPERGLFKADIKTGVVTKLLNSSGYGQNWHNNNYVKAVSNDGRFVFLGSSGLIVDTKDCGSHIHSVDAYSDPDVFVTNVCTTKDISSGIELMMPLGQLYYGINKAYFIASSNKLVFDAQMWWTYSSEPQWRMVELPSPSQDTSSEPKTLSYLALGDSYSSGEGDIAELNHYIKGTSEDGLCHLSSRSYPYLLGYVWGYDKAEVDSVACSGALLTQDYTSDQNAYMGQRRQLLGLDSTKRQEEIDKSLTERLPGVAPQIEFVKRYKPKVVTITGGGNDVGFAKVLEYCAGDIKDTMINRGHVCEYVEGGRLHGVLNDAIDTQYKYVIDTINAVKSASLGVKVYYIGYPSFIAGSDEICGYNNGSLDSSERNMINSAVTRLNSVIKLAAGVAGAQYVDIESSLEGGRLCESEAYVTGILDEGVIKRNRQESFHPNAAGHAKIAQSIMSQVLNPEANYQPTAPNPGVVAVEPGVPTERARLVKDPTLGGEDMLVITLAPSDSRASTDIFAAGFSEPTHLGVFRSKADGSLDVSIKLPVAFGAGMHLILLEYRDVNGKLQRFYDFIEVLDKGDVPTSDYGRVAPPMIKYDTRAVNSMVVKQPWIEDMRESTNPTDASQAGGRNTSQKLNMGVVCIVLAILLAGAISGLRWYGKKN